MNTYRIRFYLIGKSACYETAYVTAESETLAKAEIEARYPGQVSSFREIVEW